MIKPPIVARITTSRLPDEDVLVVVAPEGEGTRVGDEGAIWITVAGEGERAA